MAKKRKKGKKEEEQDYEFTPPEFNEKEFLKKEMSDTRTFLFTVGYAMLFSIAAGAVSSISENLIAPSFVLVIAGLASLKFFYDLLRVDTSSFTKRTWAGNIASFFFTFLAIWVLLLNVPFMDYADPSIDSVVVWVDNGANVTGIEYRKVETLGTFSWVPMEEGVSLDTLISVSANSTVNITARVADTGGLASVDIAIGSRTATQQQMIASGDDRYEFKIYSSLLSADSDLAFYIFAEDESGNESEFRPERTIPVAP